MLDTLTDIDHVEGCVFTLAVDQEVIFAEISVDETTEMIKLP